MFNVKKRKHKTIFIFQIENLDKLKSLEQLYLSHNGIEVLENLDQNTSLTTLDLASNRISKLDNLTNLENIEEFWFNDNLVRII